MHASYFSAVEIVTDLSIASCTPVKDRLLEAFGR